MNVRNKRGNFVLNSYVSLCAMLQKFEEMKSPSKKCNTERKCSNVRESSVKVPLSFSLSFFPVSEMKKEKIETI